MKTEQEIVLQKKMFIIFSLFILVCSLGILNIQKEKLQFAEIEESNEEITKIYTVYTANEELFTIEESGEALENVEEFESGEVKEEEVKKEEIKINTEEKKTKPKTTKKTEEKVVQEIKNEEVKETAPIESGEASIVPEKEAETVVASRGSYKRDVGAPPTEYERVIQVQATAYCLCKKCCGKSPSNPRYGYTASGLRIVPGTDMKVIAVDTNIVPLGTNVYVEGLNGAPSYGYAVAADTGSAIKNYKIDLYMDTHQQALIWGRKTVNLYILGE